MNRWIAARSPRVSTRHGPATPLAWLCVVLGLLAPACSQAPATTTPAPGETTWDSCYVHGEKVGYIETTIHKIRQGNRELIEIDSHNQIGIRRFGDTNQLDIRTTSVESPAGEVRRFTATTRMGPEPISIRGEVAGHELLLETEMAGKQEKSSIPWQTETKGFQGIDLSLERAPMQPGETRRLALLVPLANQIVVAEVELVARGQESTPTLDGSQVLLRIDCQLTPLGVKGKGIQTVVWTDEQGRTIKTFVAGIEQETFRTTREQALEPPKALEFDLGTDMVVKVARPLPPPAQTRRVRYRVELDGDDPSALFSETSHQHVIQTGPNTAEIVVTARATAIKPPAAATTRRRIRRRRPTIWPPTTCCKATIRRSWRWPAWRGEQPRIRSPSLGRSRPTFTGP